MGFFVRVFEWKKIPACLIRFFLGNFIFYETKIILGRPVGPGADPGFWKGGWAWGVGDKLAVRSSQVCAPGGSEGMPPRNF